MSDITEWQPKLRERVKTEDGVIMKVLMIDQKHPNPTHWMYMLTDGFWYFSSELKPAENKDKTQ